MKKILIFVILLLFVLTCASAQGIENQLIESINQSKKVVVHNSNRSDLCKGVTHTTADRGGKAWKFDLYYSNQPNQFERVIVVKSDRWYIVREDMYGNGENTENTGMGEPKWMTVKKFQIDKLTDALMRHVRPDIDKELLAVKR